MFTSNNANLPESIIPLLLSLLPRKNNTDDLSTPRMNINDSSPQKNDPPPHLKALKDFLARILASPDVMNDASFYQAMFVETCELERKKAADENRQKVVSAAVDVALAVNQFSETINPQESLLFTQRKYACVRIRTSRRSFVI
jgi:hypothetical protein